MAVVMQYLLFVVVLLLGVTTNGSGRKMPAAAVIDYLRKYGYLEDEDINKSDEITGLGLTKFQTKMGIRPSGKLDKVTEKLLNSPRCGEQDVNPDNTKVNSLIEKILKTNVVKYNIREWSDKIPKTIQNQTLYYMFKKWAKDQGVKVAWSRKSPDVNIVFRSGTKRRNGGGNLLTDVLTEVAMEQGIYTIYFYSTAAQQVSTFTRTCQHVLGHVFGRQHSDLYSIMSPIVRFEDFGKRNCELSLTGAFSHLTIGQSFFVKNDLIWKIKQDLSFALVYPPKKVSKVYQGVPDNFDDAFSYGKNYQTYVFKGSQYWRFAQGSKKVDDGFPQPISQGWKGVPDDIDAAFTDKSLQTYFIKGELVYKYHHDKEQVYDGYPKKISEAFNWQPDTTPVANFDTVFHYYNDDMVYFFKGLYYWKMDGNNSINGPYMIREDWKDLCIPVDGSDVFK